jgi:predicted acylesterase/phospholipase RssA
MFGPVEKTAPNVTFARFLRLTGVDLGITGTNISTKRPVVFSAGNTPDFPVTGAVGLSMSIPLLFKPKC